MPGACGSTDCKRAQVFTPPGCAVTPCPAAHPAISRASSAGAPHLGRNLLDKSAVALRAFGHQCWHRELSLAGVAVKGRHGTPSSCLTFITNSSLSGGRTEAPAAVSRHLLQLGHRCPGGCALCWRSPIPRRCGWGPCGGCRRAAGEGRGSEFAAGQQEWAPRSVRQAARVRGRI